MRMQTCWHQICNVLLCPIIPERIETIALLYYKLLSYFGRQDTGAHGLVCVPSVPEILSHSGRVDHGCGWCNHTNKAGPGCVIVAVMLIHCIHSNQSLVRIFLMCVWLDVYVGACGCVIFGSWEEALLKQVDHLDWLVLTGRYVSFTGDLFPSYSWCSVSVKYAMCCTTNASQCRLQKFAMFIQCHRNVMISLRGLVTLQGCIQELDFFGPEWTLFPNLPVSEPEAKV